MEQLITLEQKVTSLQIAEWTGKRHDNIMRDIKNELAELADIGALVFEETSYTDKSNRLSPMYTMGKKGVMQLALKYDAISRYKCIEKLEELEQAEKYQIPKSKGEALLLAGQLQLALEQKDIQLKEAIKTRHQISTRAQAIAMNTASRLTQKVKKLTKELENEIEEKKKHLKELKRL